ncbi:MAG: DoxX family protein [Ostreibacterium sp.]
MITIILLVNFFLSLIVVGLSGHAILTETMATITVVVIVISLLALLIGVWFSYRQRNIFSIILALFAALIVGRLFSTMHLGGTIGAASLPLDPLLIAETGPGIPILTYTTTLLVITLSVHLLMTVWHYSHEKLPSAFYGYPNIQDWALLFFRLYVGLMFIAHFTGHLFAGPITFNVFRAYFGSIGLSFPSVFVILAGLIELGVCIGLVFGFMTRFSSIGGLVYVFISVGLGGHFAKGYVWVLPGNGWEFPALWMFSLALFCLVGGGPISVDSLIRKRYLKST